MTNGSKVLIYLTLLYFISYCTLVSNAKGNIVLGGVPRVILPVLIHTNQQVEGGQKLWQLRKIDERV